MTYFLYRFGQSPALKIAGDEMKAVIPDLVSERSAAESVGNPCLSAEDTRIFSGPDIRRNIRLRAW